jgi:hypothetical protein
MDKQQFINRCRYYKGEEENPFENVNQDKALSWFYESKWVEFSIAGNPNLDEYVSEYHAAWMDGLMREDGTPITLKALLLNRYYHQNGSIPTFANDFRKWYVNSYMGNI